MYGPELRACDALHESYPGLTVGELRAALAARAALPAPAAAASYADGLEAAAMICEAEASVATNADQHIAARRLRHVAHRIRAAVSPSASPAHACKKERHLAAFSYLHGEEDDTPYDVDGVAYCGRCHRAIQGHPASPAPDERGEGGDPR